MKRKGLPPKGSPLVLPKKILLHTTSTSARVVYGDAGPPMEEGSGADEGWLRLECDAVLGLRLLQILDAGEMTVDQRSIGQRPEMFGGLQFGGVGREEVQIDVVGHTQAQTGVPSGQHYIHRQAML